MLGVTPDELIICGNSSLNIMYDTIAKFMLFGTGDGEKPWKDTKVKWLCPVPGYDRHFLITEKMGFELVNIPMDKNGPDMDMVEKLVAEDDTIKGIWCVPMYANPTGTTYSDEVVKRLAAMTTKARISRYSGITHIVSTIFLIHLTHCSTFLTSVKRQATLTEFICSPLHQR